MSTGVRLYNQLKRLTLICQEMHDSGFTWDKGRAGVLERRWTEKKQTALRHLQNLVHALKDNDGLSWVDCFGKPFNPGSTQALSRLFFYWSGGFKLAPVRWTDEGKPSTDENAITAYLRSDNGLVVAFCKKLIEYREAVKYLGTYIVGLKPEPEVNIVRGVWKAHGTVSGRFSCTEVPLQTTPSGLRHLFCAAPSTVLCETDYSQLEIRTLAVQANARKMREIFERGGDLYLETARGMFQLPGLDKRTKQGAQLRQLTKQVALSSHYMAGDDSVHRLLLRAILASEDVEFRKKYQDLSVRDVRRLKTAYFQVHPEIPLWWRRVIDEAQRLGYYREKISGRTIHFYGTPDGSFLTNFLNQSLGAHLMNEAFEKIVAEFKERNRGEHVKTQIHDSICSQGPIIRAANEDMQQARLRSGTNLKLVQEKHMVTDLVFDGRSIHLPVESKIGTKYARVK